MARLKELYATNKENVYADFLLNVLQEERLDDTREINENIH